MNCKHSINSLIEERNILYLSTDDVIALGVYDFKMAYEAIKAVFKLHYTDKVIMPKGDYLTYPHRMKYDRAIALLGYVGGIIDMGGVKFICSSTGNHELQLPRASGLLVLIDSQTQRPYCIMEASLISAVRTAAVTALAIQYLAPKCIEKVCLLGCGVLAKAHLLMWCELYRHIGAPIHVYDLEVEKCLHLKSGAEREGVDIIIGKNAQDVINSADVIIPVTTANDAYIEWDWLKKGSLYAAVSLLDAKLDVFRNADWIVVDDEALCKQEGRPLHCLSDKGELDHLRVVSLGHVIHDDMILRQSSMDRIVFNPMGTVMTDLAIAKQILDRACREKVGRILPV